MAYVSVGFDGTVNEAQWADLHRNGPLGHAVADAAAWALSQVASNRTVRIAAGIGYTPGVRTTTDTSYDLTIPTPASGNGQWFAVVMERNWATNATTFATRQGNITTGSIPTAAPTALPSGLNTNLGVIEDQIIGWVWMRSSDTTMVILDVRQIASVKSKRGWVAGSDMQRDAVGLSMGRVQGDLIYRTDRGVSDRWLDAYNASTNPAGFGDAAWYPDAPIQGVYNYPSFQISNGTPTGLGGVTPSLDSSLSSPGVNGLFSIIGGGIRPRQPGVYSLEFVGSYDAVVGARMFIDLGILGGDGVRRTSFYGDDAAYARTVIARTKAAGGDIIPVLFQASGAARTMASSTLRATYLGPWV